MRTNIWTRHYFTNIRAINNYKDLAEDFSLDGLLKSYAVFSGRKNFNDLFDSKIQLEYPTTEQLLSLLSDPNINEQGKKIIDSLISKGMITPKGMTVLKDFETGLNELIDSYPIFSLSSLCTSNLLWSHYASSHTGFCIEFNFDENERPLEVNYQKDIGSVNLIDIIMYSGSIITNKKFGIDVRNALLVKLEEWKYESEYRWIASNSMGRVPKGGKFIKVKYEPRKVKSIIFGCRMIPDVKKYIIKNLPFTTVFKQAIETKNTIEVIDFDDKKNIL